MTILVDAYEPNIKILETQRNVETVTIKINAKKIKKLQLLSTSECEL